MWSRPGRAVGIAIGLAAALAACGSGTPPLPASCAISSAALEQELTAAPGPVRLPGGTPISACVDGARTQVQLQQVGSLLTGVADQIAAGAATRPALALQLGYLVGAARRGATHTNGVASQLRDRIEAAAALRDGGPASLAALHRGILAGQSSG